MFFDTAIGPKRDPASYRVIATTLDHPPGQILFLSDSAAELDAAASAGLQTCQIIRQADGTRPAGTHPAEPDFDAVERRFTLA